MKDHSERTWHPRINGRYFVRITKRRTGCSLALCCRSPTGKTTHDE